LLCGRVKRQMIFSLDHIVFSATEVERDRVVAGLEPHGFQLEQFTLVFPESGARSDSWSFAGGGFVEFVIEDAPGVPGSPWFDQTPRVIGLGFASDAFADDTRWEGVENSWRMDEHHRLPTGADLRIHAAGPHEHRSDFYVFVMDRPDGRLEFPSRVSGPRLRRITLAGAEARTWQANLASWLGTELEGGELRVGDVELAFVTTSSPSVRATLHYESESTTPARIELAAGAIAIASADAPSRGIQ
jgi:hypothetical protein